MRRARQVATMILLRRPVLTAVLVIIGAFAVTLPIEEPGADPFLLTAAVFAFPAGAIIGLATERMQLACVEAGELGVPRHAATTSVALTSLLALTAGVPLLAAGPPSLLGVTVLLSAACAGILIATRPFVLFGIVFGAALARDFALLLTNQFVVMTILGVELSVIAWWVRLPWRIERIAARRETSLAGIGHEASDAAMAETLGVDPPEIERYERAMTQRIERTKLDVRRGLTAAGLAAGIGAGGTWRLKTPAIWSAAGMTGVLLWYAWRGPDPFAYSIVSVLTALAVFNRVSAISAAWQVTVDEQSVLVLTPRWPGEHIVKRLLVRCTLRALPAGWTTWSVVTALSMDLGAVAYKDVVSALTLMSAATSAPAAAFWLRLARQSLKRWHVTTIAAMCLPVAGVLTMLAAWRGASVVLAGIACVIAPPVIALGVLAARPLQFPVKPWRSTG